MAENPTRRHILYTTGIATTAGVTGNVTARTQENGADDEFNSVDVMFVRMMIPHHEGAIQMAELIPDRTDRSELLDLQTALIEEQEAEVDRMCELLADVDAAGCGEVGSMMPHEMGELMPADDGMGPGMHDDEIHPDEMMPREHMMTHDDRRALRRSENDEFDCLFVDHMIHHHEGAVAMSEYILEEGESERVTDLATEIIDAQEAEIEMMDEWSEEWDC